MSDTPRTGEALGATLAAGFNLGPEHRLLTELCRELERETVLLRQGDTCARQCEGTAARIDCRRLQVHLTELARFADRASLVLATIDGEDSAEDEEIQKIIDGIQQWAPSAILGVPQYPQGKT